MLNFFLKLILIVLLLSCENCTVFSLFLANDCLWRSPASATEWNSGFLVDAVPESNSYFSFNLNFIILPSSLAQDSLFRPSSLCCVSSIIMRKR